MQSSSSIVRNLSAVLSKIEQARQRSSAETRQNFVRLVAVSKTKPVEDIVAAYKAGQRHFGENYVKELVEKVNDRQLLSECSEIQWHFIGSLQRNKVRKLAQLKQLFCIESVDSQPLAAELQKEAEKVNRHLNIFVQVNTSDEDQKSGCTQSELLDLCRFVLTKCDRLKLLGLMTIGSLQASASAGISGENRDFDALRASRATLFSELEAMRARGQLPPTYDAVRTVGDLELSMGMSGDFETAVTLGATNVRVGSLIFGARSVPPPPASSTGS